MPQISDIIEYGDLASLVSLVEEDRSIIERPFFDESPDQLLHYAVWQDQIEIALFLIEQGADINACGDIGFTPLHYAAKQGQLELASILLERGANPNIKNEFNHTPMLTGAYSREEGGIEVAQFLLDSGAEADLNSLVCLGETEKVCTLLSQDKSNLWRAVAPLSLLNDAVIMVGYQTMIRNQYDPSPEQDAIVKEYEPLFECLFEAGADVNAVASRVTPLYKAVKIGIPALVRFLLENGSDVNFEIRDGARVRDLIYASQGSRKQEVRQIVEEFKKRGNA